MPTMTDHIGGFLKDLPEDLIEIVYELRDYILELHPVLHEKISYGLPFFSHKKMFLFYNYSKKKELILGLCYGIRLDQTNTILTATDRKLIRHIVIPDKAFYQENIDLIHATLQELFEVSYV